MKYVNKFFIFILFLLFVPMRLFANIAGSAHDFSGRVVSHWNDDGYYTVEICRICHTPHNAGSTEVPLWRGDYMSGWSGTEVAYTLYSSNTLDAAVNQPLAPSKACLTCHDGAIAMDHATDCFDCHKTFSNSKNTVISNDHPISFTYNKALAQVDGALNNPGETTVSSLGGKTIRQGMLYQDRVECPSCHDVHATKGDSATAPHLLLVDNKDDKLCLTCHIK